MTEKLRVAIQAASPEKRRELAALVEEAGHRLVDSGAQLILVDGGADKATVTDLLNEAAASLNGTSPESAPASGFRDAADAPPALLTPREAEILSALGEGMSNKEVARALGISAHTVKFHLETIFRKLNVASRAEAVAKGLRQGIIEL